MSDHSHSLISSPNHYSALFLAALFTLIMHAAFLLVLGKQWTYSTPKLQEKTKVIVQTIRLNQIKSTSPIFQAPDLSAPVQPPSTLNSPKEHFKPIEQPFNENKQISKEESVKETAQTIIPEPESKTNQNISLPSRTPKPLSPIKKEIKPQAKHAVKSSSQEIKQVPAKKPEPVKKTLESAKKPAKMNTSKIESSKNQNAETKRHVEKSALEKKKLQEQVQEKKRQQEIAEAQEIARQKQALSKVKESLAKVGETRGKIDATPSINLTATNLPKELGTLQVDALPVGVLGNTDEWGTKEISYTSEIAYRLKGALRLPDYGAVKIKLTLNRTGKVVKVETVQSESNKNKSYVESQIPILLFPSFGQRFQGADQNTFVITLQNDS